MLIGTVVIATIGFIYVNWFGSAVVVDETGGVESAAIVSSGSLEQPLHELWTGYFFAFPQMDGTIEVRCRDGTRKTGGYVTTHMSTKVRIVGDRPCARLVELFQ